jgi:Spy/CpxP family protein refolding chaperone
MKKGILTLALVTLISLTASDAFSQGYGRGGGRGYGPGYCNGHGSGGGYGIGRLEFLKEELGLSEKQVEKIFRIGTEFREKYFKNRKNRTKILELRVEKRKAIENVLTKKQKEKFNNLRRPGRKGYRKGPGRGYGRGPGGYPDCPRN